MIDTDKYEGHTPGPWKIYYDKWNKTGWWIDSIARWDAGEGDTICQLYGKGRNKDPTAKLIAAAPDLLAEVKRLREQLRVKNRMLDNARYFVSLYEDEEMMRVFKMWIGEEE